MPTYSDSWSPKKGKRKSTGRYGGHNLNRKGPSKIANASIDLSMDIADALRFDMGKKPHLKAGGL